MLFHNRINWMRSSIIQCGIIFSFLSFFLVLYDPACSLESMGRFIAWTSTILNFASRTLQLWCTLDGRSSNRASLWTDEALFLRTKSGMSYSYDIIVDRRKYLTRHLCQQYDATVVYSGRTRSYFLQPRVACHIIWSQIAGNIWHDMWAKSNM